MKKQLTKAALAMGIIASAFLLSCSENEQPVEPEKVITAQARTAGGTIDRSVGEPISLATARKWSAAYKATIKEGEVFAHFFGSEIIEQILLLPGCGGIRMYYGLNEAGEKQLMLVGVDSEGNDILPADLGSRVSEDGGIIADASLPCPNYCPGTGL